ncbi:hypothetical protein CCR75_004287 [Bremia lactucae]|uniref:Glucosylceramidase n=1 Tax=Bremia lactucae TaxID=4779 RepID=A0A976II44_BRELC|nr:hypothetical protein CCR75_004287 [Bremia lactucae]
MMSPKNTTAYGTSSIGSSSTRLSGQRKWITWGFVGASACIMTFYLMAGSHLSTLTMAAAISHESDVTCVESSSIDGVNAMMQPITGLKWNVGGVKNTKSFITIDVDTKYQEIMGFGGAFTEAASLQFQKLPPNKQEKVLSLYFDKDAGSGYNFGRVPMGSCDFSVASYNFANTEYDMDMKDFDMNVSHDTDVMIPFIKRALELCPDMKLFLSPWSPPGWMKRSSPEYTASMVGSAKPLGLKEDMRAPWALYFSKYITAYKNHGIPFWGLTSQNEPEFAAPWEACVYDPEYQASFIGEFLGPVLARDHPGMTIMAFDHNRGNAPKWAQVIYNHPTASKYVSGMGFHWYQDGAARKMDGVDYPEHLSDIHLMDPNRFLLSTESCNCPGVAVGDDAWFRAQRYGHEIMSDLNNFAVGWVDWNLLLDHMGGPNHKGNLCDAPIILTEDGKDFRLQPMYYFIQHFSKYLLPGSRRVSVQIAAHYAKPGDAQLVVGYQASLSMCDGSARQLIHRTNDNKLQVTNTPFCLSMVPKTTEGQEIRLVKCEWTQQEWTFEEDTQRIRIDDECLSLRHGTTEDSVRVIVAKCDANSKLQQQWKFETEDGTMRSLGSTENQCVTAGYAFLQSTAFVTPEDRTVLVVMNENTEPMEFQVQVGDAVLDTSVLPGAIRTYKW